jgi:7TMR-DISM extracellular 2
MTYLVNIPNGCLAVVFLCHNNRHLGAEGTVNQTLSYKENRPLSGLFNILFLFIVLCYNVPFALATEPCANLNPGERAYYLAGVIKSFEDKTTNQSIQDILKIPQDSWAHEYTSAPSFGFSTSAYWLKFTVCGSTLRCKGQRKEQNFSCWNLTWNIGIIL